MPTIEICGYNNGGPRSYETFRVAWSASAAHPASALDFRTGLARQLVQAGVAGVEYAQGAAARDDARARATCRANVAAEREAVELARLG